MRALLLLACLASPAAAEPPPSIPRCATHEAMAEALGTGYGEARVSVALGLSPQGGVVMIEMWANRESGTWTLTVTGPGEPTCVLSSGSAWEAVADGPLAGEPA